MVKGILRGIAALLLILALSGAAAAIWIQSSSGEQAASRWLTARLQPNLPGARVSVREIRLHLPSEIRAAVIRCEEASGQPIAVLGRPSFIVESWRRRAWRADAEIERLDLAQVDRTVGRGRWRSRGVLIGTVRLEGTQQRIRRVEGHLKGGPEGGDLPSDFLAQLLALMPPNDQRAILLRAIGAKARFHFSAGGLDFAMGDSDGRFHLLLDGDHRLEITVHLPPGGWELLKTLMRWGG